MDKKIQRLIDGSSELARHFKSEDNYYWTFPIEYINSNNHLQSFLLNNKDVEVFSLFKKDYPQLERYIENYKAPLVKLTDKEFMVHDSVRFILYNYCVFKLTNDLLTYCSNVRNTSGLRIEDGPNKRYSYPYSEEYIMRDLFLKDIEHPLAVNNLISRGFYMRSYIGGRQFLNLNHIEMLVEHAKETYDFSELKIN